MSDEAGTGKRRRDLKALCMTGATWVCLVLILPATAAGGFHASNLGLMPVMGLACICVEQLTVAIVARALGDRLLTVQLGVGPQVFKVRLRQLCTVSLRVLPVLGSTVIITARERGQRARTAVAMLAGIAVLIGAMAALVFHEGAALDVLEHRLASGPAFDSTFLLAASFVVYMRGLSALGVLARIPSLTGISNETLRARRKLGIAMQAASLSDRGAFDQAESLIRQGLIDWPDDSMLQVLLGITLNGRNDPDAFAFVEALVKRDLPASLKPMCLNLWAWQCYVREADELRAEADRASLAAVEAKPDNPSVLDTRGHVLLWLGRYADAERHLRRAYELATAAATRASSAAGLAMLYAATDRPGDAATWLARGRQQHVHLSVMARAIAAVEPLSRH